PLHPRQPGSPLFPYTTLFRSRRARAAFGLEERCAGHAPDARELGAARAAMIVDAEVEVPGARVDRQVAVERGHLRRRRELDLVRDRKSTRLNSSHLVISYAVF